MSDKPTGVFVRLPLSEEVLAAFNSKLRIEYDVKRDIAHLGGVEGGILAIGTPVTGGDLKPIGKVAGHFSDGQPMVRILNHPHLPYETEIALYDDHQAQIAALEAEVVRLREALEESRNAIMSDLNAHSIVCTVWAAPAETLVDYIDAALKGGAA